MGSSEQIGDLRLSLCASVKWLNQAMLGVASDSGQITSQRARIIQEYALYKIHTDCLILQGTTAGRAQSVSKRKDVPKTKNGGHSFRQLKEIK